MSAETPSTPAAPAAAQIAAPVAPVAPPPPTAPAAIVDPPKFVPVPIDEWASLVKTREDLAKIQADQRAAEAKAREEQLTAMAQKGQFENAFKELREHSQRQIDAERGRLSEIENRAKRYALDGELARALASQPLVPGAADQLTELWRGKFVVEPHGDSFKVQSAAGFQPPADFVAAQLARPEYAHFVRAQNAGGGTAGSTGRTTPRRHRRPIRRRPSSPRRWTRRSWPCTRNARPRRPPATSSARGRPRGLSRRWRDSVSGRSRRRSRRNRLERGSIDVMGGAVVPAD